VAIVRRGVSPVSTRTGIVVGLFFLKKQIRLPVHLLEKRGKKGKTEIKAKIVHE
jgi:hypothetical protein